MFFEKLRVSRPRPPALQLKRSLTDADGVAPSVLKVACSGVDECDVFPAFAEAPRTAVAGTALVSAINEQVRPYFLFLDNPVVLHATDSFSRYSMLVTVASMGCVRGVVDDDVWDGGGEWKNEVWADLRPERNSLKVKKAIQGHWPVVSRIVGTRKAASWIEPF